MKTTPFFLRKLLMAVVCLGAALTAQAQFTGTVNQVPRNDYAPEAAEFNMFEVANALQTDSTTLFNAFEAWMAEGSTDPNIFFYAAPSAPDTWTDAYTTGGEKGFWLDDEAEVKSYGDGTAYYANPVFDREAGTFSINIGMMPDALKWGVYEKTLQFALQFNGQTATFTIDLIVTGPEQPDVPEPATLVENLLNVVGTAEVTVEQFPRGTYASDLIKVTIADAAEKLGVSSTDVLGIAMAQILYAPEYDPGDSINVGGLKKDTLSNAFTANAPGFWLRAVEDENGQTTGECASFNYDSSVDKFFIESFAVDGDTLTCYLGQMPGMLKAEDNWFANVYLVWGDKAYRVRYNLNILEQEQGTGMANYNKVGEEWVTLEQEPLTDFAAVSFKPDLDAIAEALGCEVAAIGLAALDDSDNFGNSTANNGGYWLSEAGTVVAYPGAFYIEPAVADDYSTLNVGQMPNKYSVGDELSASIYFMNGDNYFQYNVTLKVVEPHFVDYGFQSVATRTYALQSLLDNVYTPMDLIKIDLSEVAELIGTSSPELYGLNIDSVAVLKGTYSNAYSCDPKPGFWLNADGRVSVWGDANARVGISYLSDGTMRFFQYPGRNSVGEVFKTQLFLVNTENNQMVTYNINLAFVETIVEKEVIGSENIILPVSTAEYALPLDLTKAAQAFDIDVEALMDPNNYYLRGMTSDGIYGEGVNCDTGLSFDADGGYNAYGDIYFMIMDNGDGPEITIGCVNEMDDDYQANGQFCFDVDDRQYVFYVKFMSEQLYETYLQGVNDVKSGVRKAGYIFDLQGRRVEKPVSGLYIKDGRKVVVK